MVLRRYPLSSFYVLSVSLAALVVELLR